MEQAHGGSAGGQLNCILRFTLYNLVVMHLKKDLPMTKQISEFRLCFILRLALMSNLA